jgi:catalase
MQAKTLLYCAIAGLLLPVTRLAIAVDNEVTASQVVEALEGTSGVTPGQRRNHIKGSCAVGEFIGSTEAARYTRSVLSSGKPVPVVARFSYAGGNLKPVEVRDWPVWHQS